MVTWSPDGKLLAATGHDGTGMVWDENGKEVFPIKDGPGVRKERFTVAFSPDGTRVAVPHRGGTVKVWDVQTQKEILTPEGDLDGVQSVAFSPDGKLLAAGSPSGGKLRVWDAATGKDIQALSVPMGGTLPLVFSPDSRWLAAASGQSRGAILWNTETWRRTEPLRGTLACTGLAFSPDGKGLASSDYAGVVQVWDVETGKELLPVTGHLGSVWAVAVSPDSKWIASCSQDGTVRLWDEKGSEESIFPSYSRRWAVAFSPDGNALALGDEVGNLLVWDRGRKEVRFNRREHTGTVVSACFSPDGRFLASAGASDLTVLVRDAQTGEQTLALKEHGSGVGCVAFSPDGKLLATGSGHKPGGAAPDETVRVWNAETGKETQKLNCPGGVTSVAFSPDGKQLLTAGGSPSPVVWDVETGKEVRTLRGHTKRVICAAYIPGGQAIVSVDQTNRVIVWEAATGKLRREVRLGKDVDVRALAVAPDGRHVVTANGNGTLYVLRLQEAPTRGSFPPPDPAWLEKVRGMKPEEQIQEVAEEMKRRNPGFDGKLVTQERNDGEGFHLTFSVAAVRDLTPLRALPRLVGLICDGTDANGPLLDLSPLKGLPLLSLEFSQCNVEDLTPLAEMPLRRLVCARTKVRNLTPLQRVKSLTYLGCPYTEVSDLTPLTELPIAILNIHRTSVTDLTPLEKMPLKSLWLDLKQYQGIEFIRVMKKLGTVNDKPAAEFWKEYDAKVGPPPQGFAPLDGDWLKAVREMKPEEQVQAVVEELKRRNPGYDGKVTPVIGEGAVTGLNFEAEVVLLDLTPMQALPRLGRLLVVFPGSYEGPPLDLSPLKGLPLRSLFLLNTQTQDLSPLRGLPLEEFECNSLLVSDLSPLEGMPLVHLHCYSRGIADLSPLRGMKLKELSLVWTGVANLEPLKGMPLTYLYLQHSRVRDLTPLRGIGLKELHLDFLPYQGQEVIRAMKTLEKISDKRPEEFWQEFDEKVGPRAADLPALDAEWVRGVKSLPPDEQVRAVARELERRNPGYGADKVKAERPAAGELVLTLTDADPVADLTPVCALADLKEVHYVTTVQDTQPGRLSDLEPLKGLPLRRLSIARSHVADLTPLKGMPLVSLNVFATCVTDLTPLRGMPLEVLSCGYAGVADLTPLHGMPLQRLHFPGTWVADLEPLKGMPLAHLDLRNQRVRDLTPLKGMCLQSLSLDLKPYRGFEHVRAMTTLTTINSKPAAEFWKEYDAKLGPPK
jgi:tricorn protease-like protein/Leucine-rich repeat (LRR) protein